MKRIVFLTFIGSLALALTVWGAPRDKQATRSAKARTAPSAHTASSAPSSDVGAGRTSQSVRPRVATHSVTRGSTLRSSRMDAARMRSARIASRDARIAARNKAAVSRQRQIARTNIARSNRAKTARIRSEQNLALAKAMRTSRAEAARLRSERVSRATRATARANFAINRQRNLTLARNVLRNRAGNVRITNHWRGERFRNPNYVAFHNYRWVWHDRDWWHHHFTRVVFVLGGWWYWDAGYWYPAWGYDPYAWYWYDGPIYTGYADLTPDRIIANVQIALRDQGYYAGGIDGVLGPQTRAALAAFQSDHGLLVTSAVDRPTLQTLGLA